MPDAFRDARAATRSCCACWPASRSSHRPPTGFLRGLVVEDSGEHRGRLDLKRGGIVPIADLARWAGLAAGVTHASTPARLRAAAEAGTLEGEDARLLEEAHELIAGLRLGHQVEQLKAGVEPDDFLDPGELSPLTRRSLKEAFRAVAGGPAAGRRRPAPRACGEERAPRPPPTGRRGCPARRTPWRQARVLRGRPRGDGARPAARRGPGLERGAGRRRPCRARRRARGARAAAAARCPAESIRIHGLRELDLADAPPPDEAADALLEAMAGRVLVAHAAWVERAFLGRAAAHSRRAAARAGHRHERCSAGCGWPSATADAPPTLSLGALATALGLPAHRPHTAAGDALTTAQAFIALASLLGDETVRSLATVRQRLEARRLWELPPITR